MLKRLSVWVSVLMFGVSVSGSVWALETSTSAGILLKKNASVRSAGMGDAQTAVKGDAAGAAVGNPACLMGETWSSLSAVYLRGVAEDSYGALHLTAPYSENWAFGGSLSLYDAGNFELTNETATGEETVSSVSAQRDYLATVTGAYRLPLLGQNFALGASGKLLRSTLLDNYSAMAFALDLGLRWDAAQLPLHAGIALKNNGTAVKYRNTADPLPGAVLLGVAYDAFQNTRTQVLVAYDMEFDREQNLRNHLGAEVGIMDLFFLRAGYKSGYDLNALTVGFGVRYNELQLDYTFTPSQALESMHYASVKYSFDPVSFSTAAPTAETNETDPMAVNVESGPEEKVASRVKADVVDVRKTGGRAVGVVLNVGSEQNIKLGYKGVLFDPSGSPLAGLRIVQVENKLCLGEIVGMGKEITSSAIAVLDIPENAGQ